MEAQTLNVELGERSYPIVIGSGLLGGGYNLAEHLTSNHCLVVTNTTVAPLYLDKLKDCLGDATVDVIELPDGEAHKNVATVEAILDKLVERKAGRDSTVIALGGGVVGDIAGFAAACDMRGVGSSRSPRHCLRRWTHR